MRRRITRLLGFVSLVLSAPAAWGVDIVEPFTDGSVAVLRNGRSIFIECTPPSGPSAESFLKKRLGEGADWRVYAGKGRVVLPYANLNPESQREALLTIFKYDYVNEKGWVHQVRFVGEGTGKETLWTLCEWLTGNGFNHEKVQQANGLHTPNLVRGQQVVFPVELLRDIMKKRTPDRLPKPPPLQESAPQESAPLQDSPPKAMAEESPEPVEDTLVELGALDDAETKLLTYKSDKDGPYALYHLQPGDKSIYTPVVVRFTDYRENVDILAACEAILKRSGINDVTSMETGQPIKIPQDMLSARFMPENTPERREYEETITEAEQARNEQVRARDLEGVVVILDPGHGGDDPGAMVERGAYRIYEDEINYDICCRAKAILERETRAKVYMTVRDRSQSYTPAATSRFTHDKDEELTSTPAYPNENPKYSVNLRWYMANAIYRNERQRGVSERQIIFTSFHCDKLFNEQLRGAMFYIPGAQYRKDSYTASPESFYKRYEEVREGRSFESNASERRRDEAWSRNFAETLYGEFGKKRIRRHQESAPIRNVIRQSGERYYVPAVLRYNKVPTKILVEVANMTNSTDCERMSDAEWRQTVAEAYVNALKVHFGS